LGLMHRQTVAVVHQSHLLRPKVLDQVAAKLLAKAGKHEATAVVSLDLDVDRSSALAGDAKYLHLLAIENVPALVVSQADQLLAGADQSLAHAHDFADSSIDLMPCFVKTAQDLRER